MLLIVFISLFSTSISQRDEKKTSLDQSEQFSVLTFQISDAEEQLFLGSYWSCPPLSPLLCQIQVDNATNTELSL